MNFTRYFKNRQMMSALREEKFELAIQLAKCGANVDMVDPIIGWTPLIFAVMKGHLKAVDTFLSLHADPNKGDLHGVTPGMRAIEFRQNDILHRLLKCSNIDVNQADNDGKTMLMWGLRSLNEVGVQQLIDDGRVNLYPGRKNDPISFISSLQRQYPEERRFGYLIQMIQNARHNLPKPRPIVRHGSDNVCLAGIDHYIGE